MLKNLSIVAVSILSTVTTSAATLPTPTMPDSSKNIEIAILNEQSKNQETATKEVVPEKPKSKRLVCKGCNSNEEKTLEFLQSRGITDKNALATIMGNIRQESTFHPNICEGGARIPYQSCRSGGYGLIQWTNAPRYYGLGQHAARIGANPSSLETQLDYLMYEGDWKMIEQQMKTPGGTINHYMRLAQKWIRWGHMGPRTEYAYNYANRLVVENLQTEDS
jgi:hypothetical protein